MSGRSSSGRAHRTRPHELLADDRPADRAGHRPEPRDGRRRCTRCAPGLETRLGQVGFDDVTLADVVQPGLTVIAQDPDTLGRRAAELLFERLDGFDGPSRQVVVATRFDRAGVGRAQPGGLSSLSRGGEAPGRSQVIAATAQPNVRMNILVVGHERFQVLSLEHTLPYLVGSVEPLPLSKGHQRRSTREPRTSPLVEALFASAGEGR